MATALTDLEFRKFVELANNKTAVRTMLANGFGIEEFDKVKFTYASSILTTIDFKVNNVTTNTLTFTYVGDDLDEITKTL